MDYRVLTTLEEAIIKRNIAHFQQHFYTAATKCQHDLCGYPLSIHTEHFFIVDIGYVCDLCYQMHGLVKARRHFVAAQTAAQAEQLRKRRMIDNKDGLV